jgi:small GTP-binding protein
MQNRMSVLVVGDEDVGKTALIHRFVTGKFAEHPNVTIGVDFIYAPFPGGKITFLDAAGRPNFRSTIPLSGNACNVVLIVIDASNPETWEFFNPFLRDVVYVVTKIELAREKTEKTQTKFNTEKVYFTSAATGEGVEELFQFIQIRMQTTDILRLDSSPPRVVSRCGC